MMVSPLGAKGQPLPLWPFPTHSLFPSDRQSGNAGGVRILLFLHVRSALKDRKWQRQRICPRPAFSAVWQSRRI